MIKYTAAVIMALSVSIMIGCTTEPPETITVEVPVTRLVEQTVEVPVTQLVEQTVEVPVTQLVERSVEVTRIVTQEVPVTVVVTATPLPATPTPIPTSTPIPTDTPRPTSTRPAPTPTPVDLRNVERANLWLRLYAVDWCAPCVGVSALPAFDVGEFGELEVYVSAGSRSETFFNTDTIYSDDGYRELSQTLDGGLSSVTNVSASSDRLGDLRCGRHRTSTNVELTYACNFR